MNTEDKELLLDDLCARLPYGVMLSITHDKYTDETFNARISTIDYCGEIKVRHGFEEYEQVYSLEQVKPYLFPLSSMSEEQKQEYSYIVNYISPDDTDNWKEGEFVYVEQMSQLMHFFYRNHLDFRGLIEQGLANDATGLNIY